MSRKTYSSNARDLGTQRRWHIVSDLVTGINITRPHHVSLGVTFSVWLCRREYRKKKSFWFGVHTWGVCLNEVYRCRNQCIQRTCGVLWNFLENVVAGLSQWWGGGKITTYSAANFAPLFHRWALKPRQSTVLKQAWLSWYLGKKENLTVLLPASSSLLVCEWRNFLPHLVLSPIIFSRLSELHSSKLQDKDMPPNLPGTRGGCRELRQGLVLGSSTQSALNLGSKV